MLVCYTCREPLHFEEGKGWVHPLGTLYLVNPPCSDLPGGEHRARPVDAPTVEERERAFRNADLCTS